jgi:hypothetical protein
MVYIELTKAIFSALLHEILNNLTLTRMLLIPLARRSQTIAEYSKIFNKNYCYVVYIGIIPPIFKDFRSISYYVLRIKCLQDSCRM